tara:strand:- start:523 stop:1038 length:516 start_codon:yes stop_codon:yes gene_type:complete
MERNNKKIKLVKNLVKPKFFNAMVEHISGSYFPWFLNKGINDAEGKNEKHFQFTHTFINNEGIVNTPEHHMAVVQPVLSALNVSEVLRCKMNLTTRTHEPITHGLHVDGIEGATHTAVFYLNTNNGATVFENGKKYLSIANQVVIFDPALQHSGISCTDKKVRLVLNINYK